MLFTSLVAVFCARLSVEFTVWRPCSINSLDFEHIEIPKGRPMTDAEVQQAVDHFLATLAD